ncbi:receptor kinase-like protein Xa21 [Coffea eugenioides]|uniref:receptor kinase-like protein Xa21 n=1 Tax=Coffea eugenioides TaxID=49369 RepID=UPI000F60AB69|nr:receptor kinase-like protein Xa21 [Coffea eugenioides]
MLRNNTFQGGIPPQLGNLFRLQELYLSRNSLEGEIPGNLSQCFKLFHLNLCHNKLVGSIPPQFGSLRNLEALVIHHNNLTGNIPPSMGNFTSLSLISAAANHLEGNIPDALGQLKTLIGLGFGDNRLTGNIPVSVYNLSQLEILSLSSNQLHGTLPSALGLMLPRLEFLQLRDNQFWGVLPASLSNASELGRIDIGHNGFSGRITVDFGGLQNFNSLFASGNNFGSGDVLDGMQFLSTMTNCSQLLGIDLGGNQLKGILPNSIGNLSSQILSLGANQIYGGIPSTLGNLIGLETLYLEMNQLTGTIPSTFGNLQKLQLLALISNKLSGEIPESLGNLSLLNVLYLDDNNLEGSIPPALGNCQQLILLGLSQNNLSGTIPKEIFGISSLSISLDLSQNHLSGTIPSEVGTLKNLAGLDISENHLSGELPGTFGGYSSLEILSLAGNSFQGSFPEFISSLKGIQNLNLSSNNFSGPIPQFLVRMSIKSLNLSFNDFVGELPTQGIFGNASAVSVVGNRRLCGGIPELQLPKCHPLRESKKNMKPLRFIIPVVITSSFLVIVVISISIFRLRSFKRRRTQPKLPNFSGRLFLRVSYRQLVQATNGFSAENLIGAGCSGSVYKGVLTEGGNLSVAIKVFNLQHHGAFKSFFAECDAMTNIRHRNLVKIISSSSGLDFQGNDFKALIYEFMPNGSLETWLHRTDEHQQHIFPIPNLLQRINVAIDVACAVDYLHHHCHKQIVHCDLKPSNVLLDSDLTAHVGDLGLAKYVHSAPNLQETSSAGIRGTIGYVAPEYGLGAVVSSNGDVYSFGILLLEMITGKKPTHPSFTGGLDLHTYVEMAIPERVMDIVDPVLLCEDHRRTTAANSRSSPLGETKCNLLEQCLISLLKVGLACSMHLPEDRINMTQVVCRLKSIKGTFTMAEL